MKMVNNLKVETRNTFFPYLCYPFSFLSLEMSPLFVVSFQR